MEIIKGKIIKPPRVLVYGVGGIGKTSFFANFPAVVFSDIEGGADVVGADRFPEIKKLDDLWEQIKWLCKEEHNYKTYVIDSADWLEKLITEFVNDEYDAKELSYGKEGFFIRQELGKILTSLDWLREYKKMTIGFTAHAKIKEFKDPLTDNYDIYCINCKDDKFASLIFEWCDVVGFANYKYRVEEIGESFGKKITKAKGIDERALFVTNKASFLAKNRYGIKSEMQLDANKFLSAIANSGKAENNNKGKENE